MKTRCLSRQEVRDVDRRAIDEYGMNGLVLMENAGRGCADLLCRLGVRGPVVICCGQGNNAGDGFVIARHLDIREQPVRVLLWGDPEELPGDARSNYEILRRSDVPLDHLGASAGDEPLAAALASAAWIVDALLGTGARGAPRAPLDRVLPRLNAASARRLAVDWPTGLDCDTGEAAETTFVADHTATFVAGKRGVMHPGAARYLGQLHVVDIGVPRRLLEAVFRA